MAKKVSTSGEIKTTLGKLAAAERGLTAIGELDLRGTKLYHAAKLQRLATAEISIFAEKKHAIIKELGEQRGESMFVKTENLEQWQTRIKELAAIEVSIAWAPLKVADLGDAALKASDYNALIEAGLLVEAEG